MSHSQKDPYRINSYHTAYAQDFFLFVKMSKQDVRTAGTKLRISYHLQQMKSKSFARYYGYLCSAACRNQRINLVI